MVDWGFSQNGGGWIELEFNGSFEDENGQVVFKEPYVKKVKFPIKEPSTQGVRPSQIREDPRQGPKL